MLTPVTPGVLPILLSLSVLPQAAPTSRVLERQVWVMGTWLTLRIPQAGPAAVAGAEAALAAVRDADALLSSWRPDAELARANRSVPGVPAPLSDALQALLTEAEHIAEATGRAFDPTVGALVDAWDLRGTGRRPDSLALAAALAAVGPGAVRITERGLLRRKAAAWLDSDGFGKGAALRAAARALAAHGIESALLNFGGQVLALGAAPGRDAWDVPVAHPADRARVADTVRLRNASAATSGQSERGVTVGDERVGHVLDPRTGRPVAPWGSVTVVHPDPLTADALATALFVLGPDAGLRWAEAHAVAALFLVQTPAGLQARASRALATAPRASP